MCKAFESIPRPFTTVALSDKLWRPEHILYKKTRNNKLAKNFTYPKSHQRIGKLHLLYPPANAPTTTTALTSSVATSSQQLAEQHKRKASNETAGTNASQRTSGNYSHNDDHVDAMSMDDDNTDVQTKLECPLMFQMYHAWILLCYYVGCLLVFSGRNNRKSKNKSRRTTSGQPRRLLATASAKALTTTARITTTASAATSELHRPEIRLQDLAHQAISTFYLLSFWLFSPLLSLRAMASNLRSSLSLQDSFLTDVLDGRGRWRHTPLVRPVEPKVTMFAISNRCLTSSNKKLLT